MKGNSKNWGCRGGKIRKRNWEHECLFKEVLIYECHTTYLLLAQTHNEFLSYLPNVHGGTFIDRCTFNVVQGN